MSNRDASQKDLIQTLETITRVDRLPTRDILVAQDQMANRRKTLKEINDNIEQLKTDNIMFRNQAD